MAIMIPDKPRKYNANSLEGVMFEALRQLPDDYYVFHSVQMLETRNDEFSEAETDFIILNRTKGIICLEAKAGNVYYDKGCWYYGNGTEMRHGGPFRQAANGMYRLRDRIRDRDSSILKKCKLLYAVWFPTLTGDDLKDMTLPPDADRTLILPNEALVNPGKYIDRIYALKPRNIETTGGGLGNKDFDVILYDILCPEFKIVRTEVSEANITKTIFNRLLAQQASILDFLEEQATAAINGVAGTGKTLIAQEKARRHAAKGENVLFLCFNKLLSEFLDKHKGNDHIDVYTLGAFACAKTHRRKVNEETYVKTMEKLVEEWANDNFPYKHVIIDEGQDFGSDEIKNTKVVEILKDIVADKDGTFYVFYDRMQMVQADEMPKFIGELDCRVTLSKNCRNTGNIAATSLSLFPEAKVRLMDGTVKGAKSRLHFCRDEADEIAKINSTIDELIDSGFEDIVILTCKTVWHNLLRRVEHVREETYRGFRYTTCRRFKGLEADAVILMDVDKDTFEEDKDRIFYVGTSRARIRLDIMAILSDEDCMEILDSLDKKERSKKAKESLANALNARAII